MTRTIGCGKRIRLWRKARGLQNQQLAKMLKISQGSLSDIENGNSDPSAKTIKSFYLRTDINVAWMLTGIEGNINVGKTESNTSAILREMQKLLQSYKD